MHDLTDLIHATSELVATAIWPGIVLYILIRYRDEIPPLLHRLRKAGPKGVELDVEVKRLEESVHEEQQRVAAQPQPPRLEQPTPATSPVQADSRLAELVSSNPEVGIVALGAVLEREIRDLAGQLGIRDFDRLSVEELIESLVQRGSLGASVPSGVRLFFDIRNRIAHGVLASPADIAVTTDEGLSLLRVLRAVPHETYRVAELAPIYLDEQGTQEDSAIRGVRLEVSSPGSGRTAMRIYPTKQSYKLGARVSWTWDMSETIGFRWYRNPDTGQIEEAWFSSALFAGVELDS
jgi:hypothetical protein